MMSGAASWISPSFPDDTLPEVGGEQARHHAEQRGLARAVGPDDADDLARLDREGHVGDGDESGEALGEAAHLKRHASPSTR